MSCDCTGSSDGEGVYSRFRTACETTSSLRMPNSTPPLGLTPRSTMLPGGGAICAKESFTSRDGAFSTATGALAPCTPGITCPTICAPACAAGSVLPSTGWLGTTFSVCPGAAVITGSVACATTGTVGAGVAAALSGAAFAIVAGSALIPIATAHNQESFVFIALSSLLSHNRVRLLHRVPLGSTRNERHDPGNQRSKRPEN